MKHHHICCPCFNNKGYRRKAYQYNYMKPVSKRLKEKALTRAEWAKFMAALLSINKRDYLIALLMRCFKLRSDEVLSIKRGELFIDAYGKLELVDREPVTFQYPITQIFEEVFTKAEEIENKDMMVFITSNGHKITRSRLSYSFARASKEAGIRKVFPDIIRIVNDEE